MIRMLVCALLFSVAACDRGGGSAPPASGEDDLQATPAVAYPGAKVSLRPTFASGATARIEPGIGNVVSGASYEIGPLTEDTTFTLTVVRDGVERTRVLVVPLRYREALTALAPSATSRTRAGNVLLGSGRVLQVAGASPNATYWANTQTFALDGSGFVPVGELSTGRAESVVVALPDGRALTFGGIVNASSFLLSTLVEEWDPVALAWSARGNLGSNRFRHTATLLGDGRILVAGGVATGGPIDGRDAEIWVRGVGAVSPANEMLIRRAAHTATTFPDGRVLLIGGYDLGTGDAIATCEWFDPATATFAAGPQLAVARFYHAAVPLADGRVLVVGGERQGLEVLTTAEVFDPATGEFELTGAMATARTEVRAVRLLGGDVLVAGGATEINATDRIEVWSPRTGTWREWAARLPEGRTGHALHVLEDGRVALLGGDPGNGWPEANCWILD